MKRAAVTEHLASTIAHCGVGVPDEEIADLGEFADGIPAGSSAVSKDDLTQVLARSDLAALQRELVEYWERNISFFPKSAFFTDVRLK